MGNNLLRRLPVEQATERHYGGRHRLRVVYRTRDLVILGLGVMIGSGIFKISGVQAATMAGPAVIVSFAIAGVVCLLAALCFAEMSSVIPVSGGAYSFGYVAFGELWAWLIGWALLMELLLAASVVARAWSLFASQTLVDFGVTLPSALAEVTGQAKGFDLFSLGILLLLILVLATGARLGLRTLWFMVLAKLVVIGLVIGGGLMYFDAGNLTPFVPPSQPMPEGGGQSVLDAMLGGPPEAFGVWGVLAAAPAIAFAYIGFDLIATGAEETGDAPRKVPRAMLLSLGTAIVLYIGVAVALVGMISYTALDPARPPLAAAFATAGAEPMGKVIDVGAVLGLSTVILVVLISITRVVFSMARDGLLPSGLAGISRWQVPSRATLVAGGAAIVLSQTVDVLTLEQLVVIGTLLAFLSVCGAVLVLRRRLPDTPRPFRVPGGPVVPVLAMLAVGWLMLNLKLETWTYFALWMLAGLVIYLAYGQRHSHLRDLPEEQEPAVLPAPPPPPERDPYIPGSYPRGVVPLDLPPGPAEEYPMQQPSWALGDVPRTRPGPPQPGSYQQDIYQQGAYPPESYQPQPYQQESYQPQPYQQESYQPPYPPGSYPSGPYPTGANQAGHYDGQYEGGPFHRAPHRPPPPWPPPPPTQPTGESGRPPQEPDEGDAERRSR